MRRLRRDSAYTIAFLLIIGSKSTSCLLKDLIDAVQNRSATIPHQHFYPSLSNIKVTDT
jgi:hypothetical protein